MAARENQGYLIAVIILVLLVLILGLLTFFGWSKANEYSEGVTKAQTDLNVEQKVREAYQVEAEILRAYIGNSGESLAEVDTKQETFDRIRNSLTETQKSAIQNVALQLEDVKKTYEADMQQYIARTEDEQAEELTWSSLIRNLIAVTAKKHNELAVARRENEDDQLDFQNKLDAQKKTLEETEKQLAAKVEELAMAKKLYLENEDKLNKALTNTRNELKQAGDENQNSRQQLTGQINNLETSNGSLVTENESLKTRVTELTTENFDVADGQVLRTAGDSVFVNIGSGDGLRPNMTFSVYDSQVNNFERNQQKAKIEVLEVTGLHTARAKITEEDVIVPIKSGDNVVTPTWDPGYSVPIALAGIFDLDGDGNSDRLRFIRMIENNGGTVVAQHDEEGKIIGKIDSSTRYLVLGGSPEPGTLKQDALGNVYNAIRKLEADAESHTVQVIDVRKMMNWMGLHNNAQIVRADGETSGNGFRERKPSVESNDGNSTR